jgi:hypothetical protein
MAPRVGLIINKQLEDMLHSLGKANSPELIDAARALRGGIRKAIRPKSKQVSAPGETPIGKSGGLEKSVISGAVGTGQRVAVTKFTAPLLQFGVDTHADRSVPRSRRDLFTGLGREVKALSERAFVRKAERRGLGSRKTRQQKLDPRPFMEKGLANAGEAMQDVFVSAVQRRTPHSSL